MEIPDDQKATTHKHSDTRRPSFLQRFRKSFTLVFRRRKTRKRTKSEPNIAENQEPRPNSETIQNRRSLVTEPETKDIEKRDHELDEPNESNFRPPARVPVFISELTSELKQTLQLRSRKLKEGDMSPSEAITRIDNLRALSSTVDDNRDDVKIETETKTFEEKVALFEGQISRRSYSMNESMKRESKLHSSSNDGAGEINGSLLESVTGNSESSDNIYPQIVEKEQSVEERRNNEKTEKNYEEQGMKEPVFVEIEKPKECVAEIKRNNDENQVMKEPVFGEIEKSKECDAENKRNNDENQVMKEPVFVEIQKPKECDAKNKRNNDENQVMKDPVFWEIEKPKECDAENKRNNDEEQGMKEPDFEEREKPEEYGAISKTNSDDDQDMKQPVFEKFDVEKMKHSEDEDVNVASVDPESKLVNTSSVVDTDTRKCDHTEMIPVGKVTDSFHLTIFNKQISTKYEHEHPNNGESNADIGKPESVLYSNKGNEDVINIQTDTLCTEQRVYIPNVDRGYEEWKRENEYEGKEVSGGNIAKDRLDEDFQRAPVDQNQRNVAEIVTSGSEIESLSTVSVMPEFNANINGANNLL